MGYRSNATGFFVKNFANSFWHSLSNFLATIYIGTYHYMSDKRLNKYVDEFEFRYNNKKIGEIERFDVFLQDIQGRLKYKTLTA